MRLTEQMRRQMQRLTYSPLCTFRHKVNTPVLVDGGSNGLLKLPYVCCILSLFYISSYLNEKPQKLQSKEYFSAINHTESCQKNVKYTHTLYVFSLLQG